MLTAAEASRFMQKYAKQYHAGAFGMPTAKDLAATGWGEWGDGPTKVVAVARTLTRPSKRRDWSGVTYELAAGTRLISSIAHADHPAWPSFDAADLVYGYRDDEALSAEMEAQGRQPWATAISAASEIITAWGYDQGIRYAPADLLTMTRLPLVVTDADLDGARAEVAALDGWMDDYPLYSDGSWSALSLRGFNPADPTWGVKPAEMNRKWNDAHPGALAYQCDWTALAAQCPKLIDLLNRLPFEASYERVRVLKMTGRQSSGRGGILRRHTDITDRASGTRDGQIVRFHLPIVTDPRATMTVWDLDGQARTTHLAAGSCWYLDARKPHAVTNAAPTDRIHLVADVVADDGVRRALLEAARCN